MISQVHTKKVFAWHLPGKDFQYPRERISIVLESLHLGRILSLAGTGVYGRRANYTALKLLGVVHGLRQVGIHFETETHG